MWHRCLQLSDWSQELERLCGLLAQRGQCQGHNRRGVASSLSPQLRLPPSFHVCALAADHMSRSTWHTHHCSLPTLFGLLVWNSGVGQPAWDPLLCTPSIFLFLTSADPKCPSPAWLLLPEPQAHSASGCLVSVSLEGLANVSWSPVQRCGPWSHLNLSFTSLALLPTLYPRL